MWCTSIFRAPAGLQCKPVDWEGASWVAPPLPGSVAILWGHFHNHLLYLLFNTVPDQSIPGLVHPGASTQCGQVFQGEARSSRRLGQGAAPFLEGSWWETRASGSRWQDGAWRRLAGQAEVQTSEGLRPFRAPGNRRSTWDGLPVSEPRFPHLKKNRRKASK